MKKKLKIFIFPLIFSLGFTVLAALLVVMAQLKRDTEKFNGVQAYYSKIYGDWEQYKNDYEAQVKAVKESNKEQMVAAKDEYERLLKEQPTLIADHTRTVQDTSYVPSQQSVTSSGSNTPTKKVITVTKPKSTPTTSAS